MPPNQLWYCRLTTIVLLTSSIISVFLITMMTFDRFYSIIRPHKATSFNTMKRAKITIISIITFGIVYNIPHVLITTNNERNCIPYGAILTKPYGQFYFWFTFTIKFLIPYTLLLIWNGIIIHTLYKRSSLFKLDEGQGQVHSQGQMKISERQIIIMLLLVTFGFITLTIPVNVMGILYQLCGIWAKLPRDMQAIYLFYNVGQKMYYMNFGINFFFYVMSGQKFRTDLVNLFKTKKKQPYEISTSNATSITSA